MQDRRTNSRMGVRIEGKLMSPDMVFCIDVVIRNLSETGAMISALSPAHQIPDRVYLLAGPDQDAARMQGAMAQE